MLRGNIFDLPPEAGFGGEFFEDLIAGKAFRLERIVSRGQVTPEGEWYDQEEDEWVVLLKGRARLLYDSGEKVDLERGDWLLIPSHLKHRVVFTSSDPECIWLAVHGSFMDP